MEDTNIPSGKHQLKIASKLGQGAFGMVYKGTYDGVPCAVKTVCDDNDTANSIAVRMFLREAQVLQACDHRAIIKYKALCRVNPDKQPTHDLKKDAPGGKYALVVEFAKDGTLCQKVSRQMINPTSKVYSTEQALSWSLDVASALEYLHLRSPAIFHRDVKLSNVVVTKDEAGNSCAKLNDFGLHVVADSTHDRLVRVSYRPADSTESKQYAAVLTEQHVRQLQQQFHCADAAASVGEPALDLLDKDSAWQQQAAPLRSKAGCLDAGAADGANCYAEMHESCGRRTSFVGAGSSLVQRISDNSSSSNGRITASTAAVLQQQHQQRLARADSSSVGDWQLEVCEPRRSFAFRRSLHHPAPGDLSTGRVHSQSLGAALPGAAAATDTSNRSSFYREWDENIDSSMCSMITDGTWVSGNTCDTTGSCALATNDDGSFSSETGSCEATVSDMETVFNMTGQTGSPMYMAPEVFLRQPYNEKADVFSFAVVMYELLSRCLLIFTELPTCTTDPAAPDRYAAKVAEGYRPARPKKLPDSMWQLITACWHQDPVMRPHMSEMVQVLQGLLAEERSTTASRRSSFSFGEAGRRRSFSLAGAPGPASLAAGAAAKGLLPATEEEVAVSAGTAASDANGYDAADAARAIPVKAGCGCVIS